jgi:O-methyltransferase involved in polyketide biosynthesis
MEHYFERVSVTALIPAFARGEYTDIPWARETLGVLRDRGVTLPEGPWSDPRLRGYAPLFEARFRAVSRMVEEKGATQVLELAAGLSPRGMEFARRGIVYVEADLAEPTRRKREIVSSILGAVPEKLSLCPASALDRVELLACCAPFVAGRPVAIATEGLLRYLTFEEKAQVAANVHEILRRYRGWWITPDIHLRSWAERQSPVDREGERERLGRSLDENYFDDVDHAQRFFESCSFAVESRPLLEGIRDQIALPPNENPIIDLNDLRLFILTPRA